MSGVKGMSRTHKRYCITGEPTSGKNSQRIAWWTPKSGKRAPYVQKSAAASDWMLSAVEQLVKQRGRTPTLYGKVHVALTSYQRHETPDIDNVVNLVFDALKTARVIDDDCKIYRDGPNEKIVGDYEPSILVTVIPMEK